MTSIQISRLNFIRSFENPIVGLLKITSYAFGIGAFLIIFYSFIAPLDKTIVALAFSLLSPMAVFYSLQEYVNYLKKNPGYLITAPERSQLENNFDYPSLAMLLVLRTKGWKALWREATKNVLVSDFLMRFGLTRGTISSYFPQATPTEEEIKQITLLSATYAEGSLISSFVFLGAIFSMPHLKIVLDKENISQSDLNLLIKHYIEIDEQKYRQTQFIPNGGIGKELASSYTNILDRFTTEIPESIGNYTENNPILKRNSFLDKLVLELNRGQTNSVVITGNPGVGKTEIFYHLADKIIHFQTKTALDGFSVRVFETAKFISSITSKAEAEQLVSIIFGEIIKNQKTVIFIDDIHLLLDKSEQKGTINLQSVFIPYFQNPAVRIVGATNRQNYTKTVGSDPQLAAALPSLELPMPEISDRVTILLNQVHRFENAHKVFFLFEAIKSIVELSNRYLSDQYSPEREIRLAEKLAVSASQSGETVINSKRVQEIVGEISDVPISVNEADKEILLNLEPKLHERVVGQNVAIKEIASALIRARSGLHNSDRPIGTFLFLGPTGVGKTETAKALSEIYFGSSEKMVRLDMAEYADNTGLQKLLGVSPQDPGALALMISEYPSSVVLLDEIEKSSEMVKNALLRLLDEGKITTNFGKVLDFKNTIIIATSNAGSQYIRESINNNVSAEVISKQLIDVVIKANNFSPEFLNRFDGVITYLPLTKDEINQIVKLQVSKIITLLKEQKGIDVSVSDSVIDQLAIEGYDPSFGARALNRVIKQKLETQIAKLILENNSTAGSSIEINNL
ncbi:ATP-dependent Clp protease ATP-binding subunit [Candidatus Berkelbacteria bacterium]|nr:ATP-dependent Clp protease ATP-binding subunit [Candidatus Berkelbacteria bacterium]